ncbi:hypothetical protein IIA79_08195, partial [bacterium]|nr:hypothetical protein [bacterium]
MRKAFLVLLAASLWPTWALATPSVEEIVSKAVEALRTTSYEARMKLVSHFEGGTEQVVRIYHVAPELYRVEQIVVGSFEAPAGAGAGDPGIVYIENAEELVRIRGKVVETMPLRRFHLNDALAIKFLRDLGRYPGTTVLNGWVGQYEVHVLRQEMGPNKPYTIT